MVPSAPIPWWLGRYSICRVVAGGGFSAWVGKASWRRNWQPTPVLLPGDSHGRRSLAGCSPRGREEADTTERPHLTSPRGPSPFHEALGTHPSGCGMRLGLRREAAHVACVSCWTQPLPGAVKGTPHPHRAAGAHTPSPCDRGARGSPA